MTNTPTPAAIEALFREWWAISYPTPPGQHGVNSHVGFGVWLLEQLEQLQDEPIA
ncbi:MAG: hypothetical protein VKO65_01790 [Cyanobacteriota bacterium]|nr:hypothetical protein [Cyanobacteriota bacterium]